MTQRPVAPPDVEAAVLRFETLEHEIATAEEHLKRLKAERKTIAEHDLVTLVDGEMQDGVTLSDGRAFRFERELHCSVSDANKAAALEWLSERKVDDALYKRHLTLSFPKNSALMVARVRAMLKTVLPHYEIGITVGDAPLSLVDAVREIVAKADLTETVKLEETTELAGSTLRAFVQKSMKAGVALPECFGVYAPLRPMRIFETLPEDGGELEEQLSDSLASARSGE